MALIDDLKAKLKNIKPGSTGPALDSSAISAAVRAKGGRAAPAVAAPIASTQLEASAQSQARGQLQQAQGQANLQAEALELQQAQQAEQNKLAQQTQQAQFGMAQKEQSGRFIAAQRNLDQLRSLSDMKLSAEKESALKSMTQKSKQVLANMASERKINVDNLFSQFKMENADLAQRRDSAQLQQVAAAMALSNEKYITQLNRIGTINNLQEQINFDKEAFRVELGNAYDALVDNINWSASYAERQREFEKQMGAMSNRDAYNIAMSAIEQQNKQQIANGIIQGIGVGVKAADQAGMFNSGDAGTTDAATYFQDMDNAADTSSGPSGTPGGFITEGFN